MLKGVYSVSERALPAASGATIGVMVFGPIGAFFGGLIGSAVAQAVDGQVEREKKDNLFEKITTGNANGNPVGLLDQLTYFVNQFLVWLIGYTVLVWLFPSPARRIKNGILAVFKKKDPPKPLAGKLERAEPRPPEE